MVIAIDSNLQVKNEEVNVEDIKKKKLVSLEILKVIRESQQQHGLRHGDFQRYRGFCSRRLRRLRKVLKIPQGDRRNYKRRDVTAAALGGASLVTGVRLLCAPLLQAERAWAHAMQLRREANTELRKRFHLTARLRKAVAHSLMLLQLCESGYCDARTQLEAQAYAAALRGTLALELREWATATEQLNRAQLVYEELASTLPEDDRVIYKLKVEELKPSLRYCAYNAGDASAADDLISMRAQGLVDNLDTLMAQAREARSGILHEVQWRGRTVTVRPERARLFLISLQDLEKGLEKATKIPDKIELYENILMDCKDAISAVKDEMKADPKLQIEHESQISGIQYLLSYLMYIRLIRTIERNNLLIKQAEDALKNKSALDGKKVKALDLTRLYEIILQNYTELQQLPGFENDSNFQSELVTLVKAYKALRCFYIAQVLTGLRRWREALALLERSTLYAKESRASDLKDKQLIEKLEALEKDIESRKCEVHANSVLEDDDDVGEDIVAQSGKAYKNKKPLIDRLEEYREDPQLLTKNPNVYKLPPSMEAIPCKPLFFDLACNYVEFPSLEDKIGADSKKQGAGLTGLVKGFLGWGKGGN